MILFGEAGLRRVLDQFMAHYHNERNHQGLSNKLLFPNSQHIGSGAMVRRQRLGGLLNYYYRRAALGGSVRVLNRSVLVVIP